MIKNFALKGQWFLPHNKEKRIFGTLNYNCKLGSKLELFSSFEELYRDSTVDCNIILGLTEDSKQITLYRCYTSHEKGEVFVLGGETGIPTSLYTVNFILDGAHIDSQSEMKFHRIIGEIENLDEWIGISGFKPADFTSKEIKNFEINSSYTLPDPIKFVLNDCLEGQFNFVVNRPSWSRFEKIRNIEQRVQIILSSSKDCSLEDILKHLFGFQNFLNLALYEATYPIDITIFSNEILRVLNDEKPVRKKIKLYFPITYRTAQSILKSDIEMLFAYGHIKDEFPQIIKNWYEKYQLLEPAFNLLFEQFYNSGRFSENTFLNLAQSAETYHARTHNHTRILAKDYEDMKDEILSKTDKRHHKWLEDQFNFGNNLHLQTRLTEIVNFCSNKTLDAIIGDKELFVKQVKWSRNYYTHYSTSGKKNALTKSDLFFLSEKLKILLVCAFLLEVGFEKGKLENLLERNKYRFFNSLIKW